MTGVTCRNQSNHKTKNTNTRYNKRYTSSGNQISISYPLILRRCLFQLVNYIRIIRSTALIFLWPSRHTAPTTLFRNSSIFLTHNFCWWTSSRRIYFHRLWRSNLWRCLLRTDNRICSTSGLSWTWTLTLARTPIRLVAFHIERVVLPLSSH